MDKNYLPPSAVRRVRPAHVACAQAELQDLRRGKGGGCGGRGRARRGIDQCRIAARSIAGRQRSFGAQGAASPKPQRASQPPAAAAVGGHLAAAEQRGTSVGGGNGGDEYGMVQELARSLVPALAAAHVAGRRRDAAAARARRRQGRGRGPRATAGGRRATADRGGAAGSLPPRRVQRLRLPAQRRRAAQRAARSVQGCNTATSVRAVLQACAHGEPNFSKKCGRILNLRVAGTARVLRWT
ncbi:hypothetical protein T492DRAFT_846278 [Pavlovales sp. CCMP2436]|nr:hypothetical protein T492DRAFT_846278 [Pavlovales sp. CCMP2436]